jgi:hypothetical protein
LYYYKSASMVFKHVVTMLQPMRCIFTEGTSCA